MRWPFGRPHLTLKPSKKKQHPPKKNKTENNKKKLKTRKTKKEKVKNTKIPKKSFSVISQTFLFLTGYPKIAFFDTLAQKTRTQKHYKNRGFSRFFLKKLCFTKRPFLDKKTNSEIPVIIFLAFFLFQKNTKIC